MENNKMVSAMAAKIIEEDNWEYVRGLVAKRIKEITKNMNVKNLYIVNPKSHIKLHKLFLENIPATHRKYYNCNTCFTFINRIGRLVTIDDDGKLHSLCWDISTDGLGIFKDSIIAMKNAVESGTINNIFTYNRYYRHMAISSDSYLILGTPETGEWTHFWGKIVSTDIPSIREYISEDEFRSRIEVSRHTIDKWDDSTILKVLSFTPTQKINDSYKVKSACEHLMYIKRLYRTIKNHNARLKCLWENNKFLYHLGNSALGSLFDDIQSDVFYDETCIERYNDRVDPVNYKRPKSAPTEALIEQATELIKELNMENSLKRRFALLSELPNLLWEKKEEEKSNKAYRDGVFSNVKSKENIKDQLEKQAIYGGKMTLTKFINKILPDAEKLYVITRPVDNYCAYTTAVDMDAPCIIKWDNPEARNPFSQYVYYKGSYSSDWNVHDNSKGVECLAIANGSDHLLDKELCVDTDTGVLFVLKDVYDTVNSSSGLFPYILIGELYSIRKVIESFSNSTPLENVDGQKACGILYDDSRTIEVEVHTKYAITRYHIDRME